MDKFVKELNREQRIALIRILSNLVMADKVIGEKEVKKFSELFGDGDDISELFLLAQRISFAQAMKLFVPISNAKEEGKVGIIQRNKNVETVMKIATEMMDVNNLCTPEETVVWLTICYFLRANDASYAKFDVHSFRLTDIFISKRIFLYADMNNSSQSLIIEKNFDLIDNLLSSIGFQFIYIPIFVKQIEAKGLKAFRALATYIFPSIATNEIEKVYNKIVRMTSKTFVIEYLNGKLGANFVCSKPTFYVMLGRSSVLSKDGDKSGFGYDTYADFLKITIGEDGVMNIVRRFVLDYNNKVSYNLRTDFNPARNEFLYHGFYKAFFRLVILTKEKLNICEINVDTFVGAVFINDRKLPLPVGKTAIYLMILCYSFFGNQNGLPMKSQFDTLDDEEQKSIQDVYEKICALMKHEGELSPKALLYTSLTNRISEIRKALKEIAGNRLLGYLQISSGAYAKTVIDPRLVTVNKVPIKEEKIWSKLVP